MGVLNGIACHRILRATAIGVALLMGSCTYEAQPLPRNCCYGGIELEIQLAEADEEVSIVWSGQLEYQHPAPVGTDLITNPVLSQSFDEACEGVRIDGYTATCPPKDGLRAGGWNLRVNVYRGNSAGNSMPIAGSPFTCQVDVPSMVNASGQTQPERRTKLRITEGGRASNGCFPSQFSRRAEQALIALYDFEQGQGTTVINRMGDSALDLDLQRGPTTLDWQDGFLNISSATLLATSGPATAITEAMQASNELTVEAWVHPAETIPTLANDSLARIVSLSSDILNRNFGLGQEDSGYHMRVRRDANPAPGDPANGIPAAVTPIDSVATQLTHLVATYDETETIRIYINGIESATLVAPGSFSGWDASFRLAIGDEIAGGTRAWLGQYHLVAIYAEALSPDEIAALTLVGPYAD